MPDRPGRVAESYDCICGVKISDKSKSLKKHLTTKKHLAFADCPPHHWAIETANGHLSPGYCVKCNKQNSFENSITYAWAGRNQREYEVEEQEKEVTEEIGQLVSSKSV
tara:strand:- start:6308 stop:6634 length:327 start_codon:yes stop_codon:yes gene_type:complete